MNSEVDNTGMRPQLGQSSIILPVTFDYSGGRKDTQKTAKIFSVVLAFIGIVIGLGTIFSKKGFFLTNFLLGIVIIYIFLFVIRFFLLKEGKIRQGMIDLEDSDYKKELREWWGIYSISDTYPYYCRFRNGQSGVFVLLNKDVILGKFSESEFEHYEAIGDAYNICGGSNIKMCHIDYMDNIGMDERLEESFINLERVENPDLKDLLTSIFSYQQEQMMERVTTFDAYLFMWSGSDISAWNTIQRILSCFMQANYRSYRILDAEDLRDLQISLGNLKDFSVMDAMMNAFITNADTSISPIKVKHADGNVEILGKTRAQRKEEAILKEKEEELKKEEIKRRRRSKSKKDLQEDEVIDLFK